MLTWLSHWLFHNIILQFQFKFKIRVGEVTVILIITHIADTSLTVRRWFWFLFLVSFDFRWVFSWIHGIVETGNSLRTKGNRFWLNQQLTIIFHNIKENQPKYTNQEKNRINSKSRQESMHVCRFQKTKRKQTALSSPQLSCGLAGSAFIMKWPVLKHHIVFNFCRQDRNMMQIISN